MTNESVSKLEWLAGLRGADLTHAEFRVLVMLSTFAAADLTNAYPSRRTLAEAAGVNDRVLIRDLLPALEQKGWIRCTERGGNQTGKGRANVWMIQPHNPIKGVPHVHPLPANKGVPGVHPSVSEGCTPGTGKGVPQVPARVYPTYTPSGPRSGPRSRDARADDSQPRETSTAAPPRRCPKHIHDDNPPNCHACGQARRAHETWQTEQQRADRQAVSDAARARAEDRARALAACSLCDETGYRNGRPCAHNPDQDEINRRGAALARSELESALSGRRNR